MAPAKLSLKESQFKWENVPPEIFEEIVAALLRAMGYDQVIVRHGTGDEGWDIDAQWISALPSGDRRVESWRIECKKYKGSPAPLLIRDHMVRMIAASPTPDHILFVTTASLTRPTRIDIEEIAAKARVGCSVWDGRKLEELIQTYLDDSRLWSILGPFFEIHLPSNLLASACQYQVSVEIQQRVGRKFLPELCRPRPLESHIASFLEIDPGRQQVAEIVQNIGKIQPPRRDQENWRAVIDSIAPARDWAEAQTHIESLLELAGDRKVAIAQAVNAARLRRTCFLIQDRAGSGKTNLLCRLAHIAPPEGSLFLFFSCKMDLPQSRRLDEAIYSALTTALIHEGWKGSFRNPLEMAHTLDLVLRREGKQLVILLDGINENRDLQALDQAVTDIFLRWNNLPIKFIVTCRDIFWSFFNEIHWAPFLFTGSAYDLPGFSDYEIRDVLEAYFRAFEIRGRLIGAALERCRHPLILRFFCEAHRGRDVRDFQDLRLKDLFAEYWSRKKEEIAESLGLGREGGRRVEMFLASLVDQLMDRQATQLQLGDITQVTGEKDIDSDQSIYRRLLDQDIILEELPPATAIDQSLLARRVGFVYDEFFDYMMAMAHARTRDWDRKGSADVCLDFISLLKESSQFEQLRGVAEYLVLLGELSGLHRPLCATLARLAYHEILCKALPKLRDEGTWIEDTLRCCIVSSASLATKPSLKKATGWQPPHIIVTEGLEKLTGTDIDTVFSFLIGEKDSE